jgi:asparagine synthase (glutamine-hydrolysing)
MCGICGKMGFEKEATVAPSLLNAMLATIEHRGPDDEGKYVAPQIGLGHRRLSIIDLATGHQPLSNEDDTVWIVFNGEIYNYQDLRQDLLARGHVFKTHSDTEVIIHLYEEYGEACVEKLRGMFAFAIWDDRQKILLLARDRVGIKPLYYWKTDHCLIFASEIKAIMADPEVRAEVDPPMIDRFLSFYFLPGEETLFRNIRKLAPGHYMVVRRNKVEIRQYWDLQFSESPMSMRACEDKIVELLEEAVRLHMISDVPVGFLLSGGVDSTAMLHFAVGKTTFPLSSYTLGFSEQVIADERPFARLAAEEYGSKHHEMTITSKDFMDFMPRYIWHMEEPVCEPQAVALYYVSRLAKSYVKVLISGEGGDEAFAGYQIYRNLLWLERLKKLIGPMNGLIKTALTQANRFLHSLKVAKYAPLLDVPLDSYYFSRTSNPGRFFNSRVHELYASDFLQYVNKENSVSMAKSFLRNGKGQSVVNRMLYVDTKTSLPDDLLLKADKMTMANSLELRVPFLDHKILEFAATLPTNFKVRRFTTKYVAKRALRDSVPKQILERRKAGFPVPYEHWLRTEMRDWVHDLLLDREALSRGYFNRDCVEQLIADDTRLGGFSKELLSLATLELWHRAFLKPAAVTAI